MILVPSFGIFGIDKKTCVITYDGLYVQTLESVYRPVMIINLNQDQLIRDDIPGVEIQNKNVEMNNRKGLIENLMIEYNVILHTTDSEILQELVINNLHGMGHLSVGLSTISGDSMKSMLDKVKRIRSDDLYEKMKSFVDNVSRKACLDVDDVLITINTAWFRMINDDPEFMVILKEKGQYPLEIEDIKHWNYKKDLLGPSVFKFFENGELYRHTHVDQDAIKMVKLLYDLIGVERVLFVTATIDGSDEIKDKILVDEFGIDPGHIIHTHDKLKHYKGNFVLDDGSHNFVEIEDDDSTFCLLLDKPWNKMYTHDNVKRIINLSQIIEVLERIKEEDVL